MTSDFKLTSKLREVEIIARGREIRELRILQKRFGRGRWRKIERRCRRSSKGRHHPPSGSPLV